MTLHFIGIAGRAMGAVAIALRDAGHTVTGSDSEIYEPMQSELARAGILVLPYAEAHVHPGLDVVVAGRRVAADHPECREARRLGLPLLSFPAFLRQHLLARSRNLVVTGGVGKTTTTAMLAWVLDRAGLAPDFLIGGLALDFPHAARLGGSALTVIEGDEYAAGPDDPAPKFLHYPPHVVVVTNLLGDHPDLYADDRQLFEAFARLVRTIPAEGCLIVPSGDPAAMALARDAACPVVSVGEDAAANVPVTVRDRRPEGTTFELNEVLVRLPMTGAMNMRNAAMAMTAARCVGVDAGDAADALGSFRGLIDRQQAVDTGGCVLVRDKASHPASVTELAGALRQRYPKRRLVVAIQPRATGGRHWVYQRDLPAALAGFDVVVVAPPYEHKPPPGVAWHDTPFSIDVLVAAIAARGAALHVSPTVHDLPVLLASTIREGDVVLLLVREQFSAVGDAVVTALGCRPVSV